MEIRDYLHAYNYFETGWSTCGRGISIERERERRMGRVGLGKWDWESGVGRLIDLGRTCGKGGGVNVHHPRYVGRRVIDLWKGFVEMGDLCGLWKGFVEREELSLQNRHSLQHFFALNWQANQKLMLV